LSQQPKGVKEGRIIRGALKACLGRAAKPATSATSAPRRSWSTTCCHFLDFGRTPSRTWPTSHRLDVEGSGRTTMTREDL
jgi:hypothetical protein